MPLLLSSTTLLFSKSLSSCSSRAHGGALGLVRSISKSQTIICQRRFSWAQKFLPDHFHAHPGNPSCPPLLLGLGASSGGGVGAAFLLLTGDPGRLPPCESKVLWTDKTRWFVHHPLGGLPVWRHCRLDDPEEGLGNQDNRTRYELKNDEKNFNLLNSYLQLPEQISPCPIILSVVEIQSKNKEDEARIWSRWGQNVVEMQSKLQRYAFNFKPTTTCNTSRGGLVPSPRPQSTWKNVNNFLTRSSFWKLQIWLNANYKCCRRVIKRERK